jgi:hypothetical protein
MAILQLCLKTIIDHHSASFGLSPSHSNPLSVFIGVDELIKHDAWENVIHNLAALQDGIQGENGYVVHLIVSSLNTTKLAATLKMASNRDVVVRRFVLSFPTFVSDCLLFGFCFFSGFLFQPCLSTQASNPSKTFCSTNQSNLLLNKRRRC